MTFGFHLLFSRLLAFEALMQLPALGDTFWHHIGPLEYCVFGAVLPAGAAMDNFFG